ncbi:MAG: RNA polymerase sigma factor [Paracoccaceae bacterium]
METDDEELAIAAGQGDRAAFAVLIDRHYDRIFRFGWRLSGSKERAEDIAQDIALRLPRALRGFRGEARFTTWLHRLTINAARDAARREAARTRAMSGYAAEAALHAPDGAGETRAEWLLRALAALKPDLAETAALLLGEDMTQSGAAEILGVAPGTIAWRMSEVKKTLAAMAEAEEL